MKPKLMQLSQEYFRILGINIGKIRHINLRTVTSVVTFLLGPISCAHYFFFKSQTFIDYIASCYLFCCIFICLLTHPYVTWIAPNLFNFIKSLKKIVQKGDWNNVNQPPSQCHLQRKKNENTEGLIWYIFWGVFVEPNLKTFQKFNAFPIKPIERWRFFLDFFYVFKNFPQN